MTPAAASRGLRLMSLLAAPRSLNEPVVCSCSSLAYARPAVGSRNAPGGGVSRGKSTRGVSRTTVYTRSVASRINGSTSLVSIAGKSHAPCYYRKECRRGYDSRGTGAVERAPCNGNSLNSKTRGYHESHNGPHRGAGSDAADDTGDRRRANQSGGTAGRRDHRGSRSQR